MDLSADISGSLSNALTAASIPHTLPPLTQYRLNTQLATSGLCEEKKDQRYLLNKVLRVCLPFFRAWNGSRTLGGREGRWSGVLKKISDCMQRQHTVITMHSTPHCGDMIEVKWCRVSLQFEKHVYPRKTHVIKLFKRFIHFHRLWALSHLGMCVRVCSLMSGSENLPCVSAWYFEKRHL